MVLTADDARNIADAFRQISVAVGQYRFSNWNALSNSQRGELEDSEWTLLNYSSDFITQAVGLTLNDAQGDLQKLLDATKQAASAVSTIASINKVISITGAVMKLGAAIASENPGMIVTATGGVYSAVAA
jgi:hypothetical protein